MLRCSGCATCTLAQMCSAGGAISFRSLPSGCTYKSGRMYMTEIHRACACLFRFPRLSLRSHRLLQFIESHRTCRRQWDSLRLQGRRNTDSSTWCCLWNAFDSMYTILYIAFDQMSQLIHIFRICAYWLAPNRHSKSPHCSQHSLLDDMGGSSHTPLNPIPSLLPPFAFYRKPPAPKGIFQIELILYIDALIPQITRSITIPHDGTPWHSNSRTWSIPAFNLLHSNRVWFCIYETDFVYMKLILYIWKSLFKIVTSYRLPCTRLDKVISYLHMSISTHTAMPC